MFGEANDWPTSGQGDIHQLPSRTFTGSNEGGYFVGLPAQTTALRGNPAGGHGLNHG